MDAAQPLPTDMCLSAEHGAHMLGFGACSTPCHQLHCVCAVSCAVLCAAQESDSAGQKLGGALLNALIFMAVIGGMTFVLFLLFKWGVSSRGGPCWQALCAAVTWSTSQAEAPVQQLQPCPCCFFAKQCS